jgi:hypothetical protein
LSAVEADEGGRGGLCTRGEEEEREKEGGHRNRV